MTRRLHSSGPFAGFLLGAGLALLLARFAPPYAGKGAGYLLARAGRDPFGSLAQDHRRVLALIDAMARTPDSARVRRAAMLLQLKRMLAAHAMAEEDVLYPMLMQDAGRDTDKLYHEHAEMKLAIFALEHLPKSAPEWLDKLRALRALVAEHARIEEEEEFPKLRAALAPAQTQQLSGDIRREKGMLL